MQSPLNIASSLVGLNCGPRLGSKSDGRQGEGLLDVACILCVLSLEFN